MHPWSLYALEIARDRQRESYRQRLVTEAVTPGRDRWSRLRHPAAVALAALSRGSANAARRLDDCVADDLTRSFVTAK
jgi:hypothetical protein